MSPPASRMTYVDTSVWCAYCYNEPESPGAVRWLAEAELDRTATALWTHAEFASASGIKLRDKGEAAIAIRQYSLANGVLTAFGVMMFFGFFLFLGDLIRWASRPLGDR